MTRTNLIILVVVGIKCSKYVFIPFVFIVIKAYLLVILFLNNYLFIYPFTLLSNSINN